MRPRVDHIGVIVGDLDSAVETFSRLLQGVAPIRRDLPEAGLRIAEFHTENLNIELIAYDGSADFARQVMGEEIGINHLSIQVEDVGEAIARLADAGLRVQPGFPRRGAHGTVAFFERDETTGLLFEVCAPDASSD
jgi:catechol 2,3-dioxygenase-like lactoylglutathione lyase family enzyme